LIKKINQQVFAAFFTKEFFETEVGIGIEVFANHVGMERMDLILLKS
jgi:hypothetical protein